MINDPQSTSAIVVGDIAANPNNNLMIQSQIEKSLLFTREALA